ncbi:hypothetical protein BS47DRAFT_1248837, partial [Hydnum rufescens UP504]
TRPQPSPMLYLAEGLAGEFVKGYQSNIEFGSIYRAAQEELLLPADRHVRFLKGENGLLYFRDADWPSSQTRLCIPSKLRLEILGETHDSPHKVAHGG